MSGDYFLILHEGMRFRAGMISPNVMMVEMAEMDKREEPDKDPSHVILEE